MKKVKRLIVISGASKGIGRAIVESFAAEDFNIAAFSRNENDIFNLRDEIQSKYSVAFFAASLDVSDKNAVESFAETVLEKFGVPDVLVNNAGIFKPGQIQNEEDGVLEDTMAVNLNGSYYLTRAFLPSLISAHSGHIFNMCSIASITAYTNGGSYAISKHALLGFSKVLREEMKEYGVKVTALLPGATYTDSWAGAGIPESRFMSAEDIAYALMCAYKMGPSTVVEEILLRPLEGDI